MKKDSIKNLGFFFLTYFLVFCISCTKHQENETNKLLNNHKSQEILLDFDEMVTNMKNAGAVEIAIPTGMVYAKSGGGTVSISSLTSTAIKSAFLNTNNESTLVLGYLPNSPALLYQQAECNQHYCLYFDNILKSYVWGCINQGTTCRNEIVKDSTGKVIFCKIHLCTTSN
jgi:hypothetical protein